MNRVTTDVDPICSLSKIALHGTKLAQENHAFCDTIEKNR